MPEGVQEAATETRSHSSAADIYCRVHFITFTLWETIRTDFRLEVVEKQVDAGVSGSIMGLE